MKLRNEQRSRIKMGGLFTGIGPPEPEPVKIRYVEKPEVGFYELRGDATHKIEFGTVYIRQGVLGIYEVPRPYLSAECPD